MSGLLAWLEHVPSDSISIRCKKKRNAVWIDLRGSEQVDAMDVWFSVFLQMWARERKISQLFQSWKINWIKFGFFFWKEKKWGCTWLSGESQVIRDGDDDHQQLMKDTEEEEEKQWGSIQLGINSEKILMPFNWIFQKNHSNFNF